MILELQNAKQVTIKPAVAAEKVSVTQVEVFALSDDMTSVKAAISVNDYHKVITLWEGEAYEEIGDWTQAQANARIIELL